MPEENPLENLNSSNPDDSSIPPSQLPFTPPGSSSVSKTHPVSSASGEIKPTVTMPINPEYAAIRRTLEADQMFFEADQKIKDGKTTEALAQLVNLIEQYPEYGRAYNHIGFIYETKYRDAKKAVTYYERALQYTPEYPAIYLNYSLALSNMERFDLLEDLLTKALKVEGVTKDRLYNEWGIMRELQQRYEEAIEFFKKAIRYSLSENDIELYKKNIQRCRLKEELEYF